MTRRRLLYLHKEINRHGKTVWYVRKGAGPRIRLRGDYMSEEFMAAYHAAMAQITAIDQQKPPQKADDTLAGLITLYRQSTAWSALSETTRKQRETFFHAIVNSNAGSLSYRDIVPRDIIRARDARKGAGKHFAAANYLKCMRGLFRWACELGLIDTNPALGVKPLLTKTNGFHTWTEAEAARFEAKWPIGSRERLAFAILAYTGMRRGDAYRLGRQHIRDGVIYMPTEKNGVNVSLPVHPDLQAIIDATPSTGLALIAKANGCALDKFTFGNWFRRACNAAGVPGSAHGLRKLCAVRWALTGATEIEMMAWFGWQDRKMAAHYTQEASRVRLAKQMFAKLQNTAIKQVN
jgi:integrase